LLFTPLSWLVFLLEAGAVYVVATNGVAICHVGTGCRAGGC
jgi:hypothetical protein